MRLVTLFLFISTLSFGQGFSPSYQGALLKFNTSVPELSQSFYFNGVQFKVIDQSSNFAGGLAVQYYTQDHRQNIDSFGLLGDLYYRIGRRLVQPYIGVSLGVQKMRFYGSYLPAVRQSTMGPYLGDIVCANIAPTVGVRYLVYEDDISEIDFFVQASRGLQIYSRESGSLEGTKAGTQSYFNVGVIFMGL